MNHSGVHCLVAIALSVAAIGACVPQDETLRKAQEIWRGHESVIAQAVHSEEPYDADQFVESVDFFREVAGIEIRVEIYTMGYMPTGETAQDLEKVRAWYEANGDRLLYDENSRTVRVEGDGSR